MTKAVLLAATLALASCSKAGDAESDHSSISFEGANATQPAEILKHGTRIVTVLGCGGCHGKTFTGQPWDDDPKIGRLWSSNLTIALADYSDAQLERLLREGKHRTRKDLWIMPSENFRYLSGKDMAAVIARLRTLKPSGARTPPPIIGPGYRRDIAAGKMKPAATIIAETRDVRPIDTGPAHALGRYITSVTCAECHNLRLEGWPDDTPDLAIAAAYPRADFHALMRTGKSLTGRDLGLMSEVARNRFSHLSDSEVDAVYDYLVSRAALPDPTGEKNR